MSLEIPPKSKFTHVVEAPASADSNVSLMSPVSPILNVLKRRSKKRQIKVMHVESSRWLLRGRHGIHLCEFTSHKQSFQVADSFR